MHSQGRQMNRSRPSRRPMPQLLSRLIGRLLDSPTGARLANFGPVAWLTRTVVRTIARRQLARQALHAEPIARIASADLAATLSSIVTDVVDTLGYVGAIISTYDSEGALLIRAWYVDPTIASERQIREWERQVSRFTPSGAVSLSDPRVARVFIDRPDHRANLSSRAFLQQQPVSSRSLFDLFRPIVPDQAAPTIAHIQAALGVREVIAIPFFLEAPTAEAVRREFVGNLFVLAARPITPQGRGVLAAFGRQAAAAILSDRRRSQAQAVMRLIFDIQARLIDEAQILQQIVKGVVQHLAYIGAFVATYEADGALAVRAWHFDPAVASRQQILAWEAQISQLSPDRPISLDPAVARVYVDRPEYRQNLSSQAFHQQHPVYTTELYDLFCPVVPESSRPAIEGIQAALKMRLAVAVPFFFSLPGSGHAAPEFVGNLFALSRAPEFSGAEIEVLQAFGQQAAASLHNARLYRQAESRRKTAAIFGKMAFTAAAAVHELKNKVGVVRMSMQLIKDLPDEALITIRDEITEPVLRSLEQMTDMLDSLHEPWQQVPDRPIEINPCLERAVRKVIQICEPENIQLVRDLAPDLPPISGSQDMVVEVLKVMIRNAVESIAEKGVAGMIRYTTAAQNDGMVCVTISDNGTGIRAEELEKIFEMGWSTKGSSGLGFGLFWARDYIEGLGGNVHVTSSYGEGATFQITFPSRAN